MGPSPVSSDTWMQADILELLVRARNYRGEPHRLYSHIAAMGDRYLDDPEERRAVRNSMDAECLRDRSPAGRRGRTG